MNCPKCGSAMTAVAFEGVEVERCTGCRGLWFDLLEQQDLREKAGSEAVDIGSAADGARYNEQADVDCPHGHGRMVKMVDAAQPDIRYEMCSVCHGTFFDAGEFTDYKQETVVGFFKRLRQRL